MARFDVYAHPDATLRKNTPYLLDVQNSFLDGLATRVVIPMRSQKYLARPTRDLNPIFEIAGKELVLDTAAMAAFPSALLKRPVDCFTQHAYAITHAMDTLFGPH
jgi:toxin CcdB